MRTSGWAWLVRSLILLGLGTMLVWWGVLEWGAEHHWLLAALQYAPYWALLAPLVVTFLLSWTQGWRWRLLALAALLLLLGPVMGLVVSRGDAGAGHVRLMTYNIKAYLNVLRTGGVGRVAWEVAEHNPDIVVMQDAGEVRAAEMPLPEGAKQLIGDRQLYATGQYIVASRFPLRDCSTGLISYAKEVHTYVHCVVHAYGQDIDLYTAHLLSPRDGLNALRKKAWRGSEDWERSVNARLTQSKTLAEVLSHRQRPAILAGDLNAPERSMVVQTLLDVGLRDAFSAGGWGYGYTHGHSLRDGVSINRIDHILVSDEIGVADCQVGGKEASDHRPVIADLWIHRD
ncbi:MAG: endonuclease/exonuclease/phosphatase family protein [Burkholderiales bacterium]|nr:endonuclease/exonuclease/phosphatase family protein [Burkholderiales bacterium]